MKFKNSLLFTLSSLSLACLTSACGDNIYNYYDKDEKEIETNDPNKDKDKPPIVVDNTENTQARCSDGIDNDKNGTADCDDPNCSSFTFCAKSEEGKENTLSACVDGEDNDGDGDIDCDDAECKQFTICQDKVAENTEATCKDGLDNDGDGNIDCDDSECKAFSMCQTPSEQKIPENTYSACIDEVDNDGDGKIDCDDAECKVFSFCQQSSEPKATEDTFAACSDKQDNDGDGKIDCDDPDCKEFAVCQPEQPPETPKENTEETCTDGIDNDGDGDLDCLDKDCQKFEICQALISVAENTIELCTDGIDNDFNGVADDKDPNCEILLKDGGKSGEVSYEQCKDKKDNDGDGKMDCNDPECALYDVCMKDFKADKDECPDDPFKFKNDDCGCGKTKLDGKCYINITRDDNFFNKIKSNLTGDFLIKQPIDLGETKNDSILDFKGTLNGGNHRITGVLNQTNAVLKGLSSKLGCGLFGWINTENVVFKDIDIAITLNCRANGTVGFYVGALAAFLDNTSAEHITGSSKVYVQIASSDATALNSDIHRYVGGLFGYAKDVSDVKLVGNVSANFMDNLTSSTNRVFNIIGGVTGYATTLKNIEAEANVTLNLETLNSGTTRATGFEYIGGIAGGVSELENASNRGHVKISSPNTMKVNKLNLGGLTGEIAKKASNISFIGMIENSNSNSISTEVIEAPSGKLNYGNRIGGITGQMESNDALEIDRANVDADIITLPDNALIGGIVGVMTKTKTVVRNSTSNVNLTLLPTTGFKYSDGTYKWESYYGGIAGGASGISTGAETAYIINNSAHTNFINIHNLTNLRQIGYGGIIGYNSGILVNNFASDRYICTPDIPCPKIVNGIGGLYAYESYYNQDFASNSGSYYSDASTEAYQFNATGTPVTRTQKSVLGLLRYNAGYDGGVLSANIPANIGGKYSNWTTKVDDEGHVIPVPVNK